MCNKNNAVRVTVYKFGRNIRRLFAIEQWTAPAAGTELCQQGAAAASRQW